MSPCYALGRVTLGFMGILCILGVDERTWFEVPMAFSLCFVQISELFCNDGVGLSRVDRSWVPYPCVTFVM
jgi:hypothetical protein